MIVLVYIALGLVILYFYLRRNTDKYKTIPGPKGWPLIGYAPYMKTGEEHETFSNLAKEHGDIYKLQMFGKTVVLLNNAHLIRLAFSDDRYKRFLNDKPIVFCADKYFYGGKTIGFTPKAYDSEHGDLRKLFERNMHVYREGQKDFEAKVTTEFANTIDKIDQFEGKEFQMNALLRRSLSNILSIILGGHDLKDDEQDIFWDYLECLSFFFGPTVNMVLSSFPFLCHVPGMYKSAAEKLERAIDIIIRRFVVENRTEHEPKAFVGIVEFYQDELLKAQREGRHGLLTDDKIKAQLLETIGAASISTLTSLTSLFLCLINYPEYQIKIQAEVDRFVGKDRRPGLSDRAACVFTEAVILEAQRYVTVTPFGGTHFCEDGIEFEGYDIPPKSQILPNVWYVHHDEKIWGDPWNFRPERWLDENGELLPIDHDLRKNWIPFGVGRRQCAGEQFARSVLFLYIANFLQSFTFDTLSDKMASCDPRHGHYVVDATCMTKPYMCRAIPRNSAT